MIPIVDGHCDALLRAWAKGADLAEQSQLGHFDVPRARRGGVVAAWFAVFVPFRDDGEIDALHEGDPLDPGRAARVCDEMVSILLELERRGELVVARRVADVESAVAGGPFAAILHLEGAEPIDPELRRLDALVQSGLRSVGPVWSRPNAFGAGVDWLGRASDGAGLSAAGRRLVRACNEHGVLLDLSHLNDAGFADVVSLSRAPLVATHSGARAVHASPRCLTDDQLRAVASSGGVVGVPLVGELLERDGEAHTSLELVARHVEHIVAVAGEAHVALGSDFDGGALLGELGDAAGAQRALEAVGWDERDLRKLAHENWLRVLRHTWQD